MTAIITGDRELEVKFDQFPQQIHGALLARITQVTETLQARVESAAPRKTGRLKSEVRARVYSSQNRIAGYVSIYAPGVAEEYAKAATLEYGTNKPRHAVERVKTLLGKSRRRILNRISKPVHISAMRYLRGPFDEVAPDIQADLQSVVNEVASE
jgi:hypothetical protein